VLTLHGNFVDGSNCPGIVGDGSGCVTQSYVLGLFFTIPPQTVLFF